MIISSNMGKVAAFTTEEFKDALRACMEAGEGNEICCSPSGNTREETCLSMVVGKPGAMMTYYSGEEGNQFVSLGDQDKKGSVDFLDGQYEVAADQIVSRENAMQAAVSFFENQERPDCIQWEEL